jgi:hypothetical protein
MNRQRVLKQRAARNGVFVMRALDAAPNQWDVVDSCGHHGGKLTKRAAINLAAKITAKQHKFRMYGTDIAGTWHRWNCLTSSPA